MTMEEIEACFFRHAISQGKPYTSFPLDTKVEEFGAPYIELHEDGKAAIIGRDRGIECFRKETSSPEILAKWIFDLFNHKTL